MTAFTKRAYEVFAGFDAAGNPRKVENHDGQVWGTEVERALDGAAEGRVIFSTWAQLAAIDGTRDGQPGRVVGPDSGTHTDPVTGDTVENVGDYRWSDSPEGWERTGDLPNELIRAVNSNSGDPNAITADPSDPIPAKDWSALIALNIVADNTADAPTVQFAGDSTKYTITDAVGTPVSAGGLSAGMLINGYIVGTTFRVDLGPRGWSPLLRAVNDGERRVLDLYDWVGGHGAKPTETGYLGSTGLVPDRASAVDVRGPEGPSGPGSGDMLQSVYDPQGISADAFDPANQTGRPTWRPKNVSVLLANNTLGYAAATPAETVSEGDILVTQEEGYAYRVAAAGASDEHVSTAGGVNLYVIPLYAEGGRYPAAAFGDTGDGTTDDRDALAAADVAGAFIVGKGKHRIASDLTINSDIWMEDGATLVPDAGVTVTINGLLHKPSGSAAFGGDGAVTVANYSVNVPGDFSTIQEAVNHRPRTLYQTYQILLADGTYDEDVLIEDVRTIGLSFNGQGGPAFVIRGANNIAKDPNVRVRSFAATNAFGSTETVSIKNMTVFGVAPYEIDEGGAVVFWGVRRANAVGLSFDGDGATYCLVVYASDVTSHSCDFGNGVNDSAILTKHGGTVIFDTGADVNRNTGHLNEHAYHLGSSGGPIVGGFLYDLTSNKSLFRDSRIGVANAAYAFDTQEGVIHGLANFGDPGVTRVYTMFESIEGYATDTGGTGSVSLGSTGPVLNVGGTGGYARMSLSRQSALFGGSWAKSRDFAIAFRPSDETDILIDAVTGDRDDKCFGVRYQDGILYGIARNGGSTQSVNLGPISRGQIQVFARYYCTQARTSPNNRVEFHDRNGNKMGELSTGLPTGAVSASWNVLDFYVASTSSNRAVSLGECYMAQRGLG